MFKNFDLWDESNYTLIRKILINCINYSILVHDYVFSGIIRGRGGFGDIDTVSYIK